MASEWDLVQVCEPLFELLIQAFDKLSMFELFGEAVKAPFGLNHSDSVSNLIRRAEKHLAQSRQDRNLAARIVETITKTENRV